MKHIYSDLGDNPISTIVANTQPWIQAGDILVNLRNVSNINILKSNRIVFNMNYMIGIIRGNEKRNISDYVYWDSSSLEIMSDKLSLLKNHKFIKENFIFVDNCYVNTSEISSVKFLEKQNRVVLNLSHPVTFNGKHNQSNLTSEFVYINCKSVDEFISKKKEVITLLGL